MTLLNNLMVAFLLLGNSMIFAQLPFNKTTLAIAPDSLSIAYFKTTNIIFPYAIKSVDRGSADLLAQKAKGVQNILQLKAAHCDFTQTNLSVITADGQLHSFIVSYKENPPELNLVITESKPATGKILGLTEGDNQAELVAYAREAGNQKKKLKGIKVHKYQMRLQLNGLFIHQDVLYFRIKLVNNSNINYKIGQLRFFIRDQKKSKRTASQQIEIFPLHTEGALGGIKGETEISLVYALAKFTLAHKKYLAIELMEEQGGRHLELELRNNKMAALSPLPVL